MYKEQISYVKLYVIGNDDIFIVMIIRKLIYWGNGLISGKI